MSCRTTWKQQCGMRDPFRRTELDCKRHNKVSDSCWLFFVFSFQCITDQHLSSYVKINYLLNPRGKFFIIQLQSKMYNNKNYNIWVLEFDLSLSLLLKGPLVSFVTFNNCLQVLYGTICWWYLTCFYFFNAVVHVWQNWFFFLKNFQWLTNLNQWHLM